MPRFRPTYANVMSTLALFVALGGVGYAAATLPSNSVGTKQLKKNAVQTSDIKKSAVNSSKVKNGSLLEDDFKSGQLPAGQKGDRGPQGPTGGPPPVEPWKVVGTLGQPQFLNTWTNHDTSTYNSAAFFRDASGVVHLRGVIASGTALGVFQLPAGYFPPKIHNYAVTTLIGTFAVVSVQSGGLVTTSAPPPAAISLEGISFRATG